MRILYLIDCLGVGGKERQAVELLKGIKGIPQCKQMTVCLGNKKFYMHELEKQCIEVQFLKRIIRWDPLIFIKLLRKIVHFRPEIIHTNGMLTSFYAIPIAKLMKIKVINGSIRNAYDNGGIRWWIERTLLLLSDYRVSNSKAGLISRRLRIGSERNVTIYNGFSFDRVSSIRKPDEVKKDLGVDGMRVVGMVAEFSDCKDYKTYFQAAEEILKKNSDVAFIAVGSGKNFNRFKKKINHYKDRILLIGKRKDVEDLVSIFDIGVLSTFVEGISNSVMEYMALGKPVIVTNGGGTPEIVENGETGFLIAKKDPHELAEKIQYLLDNDEVAKKMGELGKTRLLNKFSLDNMVKETMRLYERALGRSEIYFAPEDNT